MKYFIELNHQNEIEAESEEVAREKFLTEIENKPQQDFASFVSDNLKVKRGYLASELKGEAREKVVDKHRLYNVQYNWLERHEEDLNEILRKFGLEMVISGLCYDFDSRLIYFTQNNFWVEDFDKLTSRLKEDIDLPDNIVENISRENLKFKISLEHYGSNLAKNLLILEDCTDDGEFEDYCFDEEIQDWFEINIMRTLYKYIRNNYCVLTSDEEVINSLDAEEFYFSKEGEDLN